MNVKTAAICLTTLVAVVGAATYYVFSDKPAPVVPTEAKETTPEETV